ncbi:MAG: type 4a pilus biogenesis protein PilO [Bdellovibrionales bacterium]|nr:type 4a pilus biogenesis protein PilO [Bdellovibrionales bacterium]
MSSLDTLGEMPLNRSFLLSLILCGVYYLISFDNGDRFKNMITESENRKNEINKEMVKVDESLSEIRALKLAQERDLEKLTALLAFIPEKLSKIELMRTISNEAKAVGANINQVQDATVANNTNNDFYEEVGVDVELVGSFTQLMLFLSNLTRLNQILTLNSLELKGAESSQDRESLGMTAQLRGYRYTGKKKEE